MRSLSYVKIVMVLVCFFKSVNTTLPSTGNTLDCSVGSVVHLGAVDEGYTGDIEITPGTPDAELVLEVLSLCPQCAAFLEFSFNSSTQTAIVRTKKPLDTEALTETGGVLSYEIICNSTGVPNRRTLFVTDVNDNKPVFDKEEYRAYVLETLPVNEVVVQVSAVDADVSPIYNHITYSIQPPSTMFEVNVQGKIFLKERLNYTTSSQHNLTVKAQDLDNLFSKARVIINVALSLQIEYDHYEASIPENELVPVLELLPAPIKASTMGHHEVIYSISKVSPSDYWSNFTIDQSTGVIQVLTELDFEEMKDPLIIIHIKASLKIDSTTTANTTVTVHVENVNEAPVFNVELYTAEIFSAALTKHVVQVEATDPDVGDTLQYSLVDPSSMFAVEPSSGQVYVVSSISETEKFILQVKAEDQLGLYDTTTVEVIIKKSDNKDVVVISLNQEIDTVQNKSTALEEALERTLGWSVTIINVTSSSREESALSRTIEIRSVQSFVSFLATEINGNSVIPKDTVQNKLTEDEKNVQEEMVQVFGIDVQFDIVDDGDNPSVGVGGQNNLPVLSTAGVVILTAIIAVGVFMYRRQSNLKNHTDSRVPLDQNGDMDSDSQRRPDLRHDTDPMEGTADLEGDRDSERERHVLARPKLKTRPKLYMMETRSGEQDLGSTTQGGEPDLGSSSKNEEPDLGCSSERGEPDLDLEGDKDSKRGRHVLARYKTKKRPKLYMMETRSGEPDLGSPPQSGEPDLGSSSKNEEPDLGRNSEGGEPDLRSDRSNSEARPGYILTTDFMLALKDLLNKAKISDLGSDMYSMSGGPNLEADRSTLSGGSDCGSNRSTIGGKSDFGSNRSSLSGRSDLRSDRSSNSREPDLRSDRSNSEGGPWYTLTTDFMLALKDLLNNTKTSDLGSDMYSMSGGPNLEGDRSTLSGGSDFESNGSTIAGEPGLRSVRSKSTGRLGYLLTTDFMFTLRDLLNNTKTSDLRSDMYSMSGGPNLEGDRSSLSEGSDFGSNRSTIGGKSDSGSNRSTLSGRSDLGSDRSSNSREPDLRSVRSNSERRPRYILTTDFMLALKDLHNAKTSDLGSDMYSMSGGPNLEADRSSLSGGSDCGSNRSTIGGKSDFGSDRSSNSREPDLRSDRSNSERRTRNILTKDFMLELKDLLNSAITSDLGSEMYSMSGGPNLDDDRSTLSGGSDFGSNRSTIGGRSDFGCNRSSKEERSEFGVDSIQFTKTYHPKLKTRPVLNTSRGNMQ